MVLIISRQRRFVIESFSAMDPLASTSDASNRVLVCLLHEIQTKSLAGMRLVQHLQIGGLLGCLTHLSLAGVSRFKGASLLLGLYTDVAHRRRAISI
jgi:hypothetical protein